MNKISALLLAGSLFLGTASATSLSFVQDGWSTGAILTVAFSGEDANGDSAILLPELTALNASWISPLGISTNWNLSNIEPDSFVFIDPGNYLFFTTNPEFALVSTAFEGEALASVFDASLFLVDSTDAPATAVPEPAGLAVGGIAALAFLRRRLTRLASARRGSVTST